MSDLFDFDNDGKVSDEEEEDALLLLMDDDDDEEERRTQSGRGADGCLSVLLVIAFIVLVMVAIL